VEIYPNERKDTYFSVYDCDESIDGGRKKRKSTKRKRKNRKLTKRKRKKSK